MMQIHMPDGSIRNVKDPDAVDEPVDFLDLEIDFFKLIRKHFLLDIKVTDAGVKMGFKPVGGRLTFEAMGHMSMSFVKNPAEIIGVAWAPELDKAGQKTPLTSEDLTNLRAKLADPDAPAEL